MPTTTFRTKTRGPLARRAGIVCLIGSLAACSSGSHTTSQTSKPKPSTPKTSAPKTSTQETSPLSVREFFAGEGKPLLAFERATKVIATGSAPQHETCVRLTGQVLPKIIADPNLLFPLTLRIPDGELANAFSQDVRLKVIVLLGCRIATPPTGPGYDPEAYPTVRKFANEVKRLLAPYGIDV